MLYKKTFYLVMILCLFGGGVYFFNLSERAKQYGAPPYVEEGIEMEKDNYKYFYLSKWERPEGPLKVGLQAGHWKNSELPDELESLRGTSMGTKNGEVTEWEVNLIIAEQVKKILEKEGIMVDILPSKITPGYYSDAFVSIHADGSTSPSTNGFKVAPSRMDRSGKAEDLSKIIEQSYLEKTGLSLDPNITRNMRGYYAFNWRRYDYSIHPMTPAVLLETGFLTSPKDSKILINNPALPAGAIAEALIKFLKNE